MPISSYPRITLNNTNKDINPQNGTGIVIYDFGAGQYRVLDSQTIPVNEGGFAANNTLISSLGPKLPDLLVDISDQTIANRAREIEENLRAINFTNESAGDLLYQILFELQNLNSTILNGTGAIQIKGSNGNLANVSGANRLAVTL